MLVLSNRYSAPFAISCRPHSSSGVTDWHQAPGADSADMDFMTRPGLFPGTVKWKPGTGVARLSVLFEGPTIFMAFHITPLRVLQE